MKEEKEDEVLFQKNDEDLVIVAIASIALTQTTNHNVTMLNGEILQAKYGNIKLKDEIISLQEEM